MKSEKNGTNFKSFVIVCIAVIILLIVAIAVPIAIASSPKESAKEPENSLQIGTKGGTYEVYLVGRQESGNFAKIYRIILHLNLDRMIITDKITFTDNSESSMQTPFSEYKDNENYSYKNNKIFPEIYNPSLNGVPVKSFDQITSLFRGDRLEFYFKFACSIEQTWNNGYSSKTILPDLRNVEDKLMVANFNLFFRGFQHRETNQQDSYYETYGIKLPRN